MITLNLEYDFTTVRKLGAWAKSLSDEVDFIDYWYNLFLSETKYKIEESIMNNINSFHWTRWQEDFEEFVDKYKPITGTENFYANEREWFAVYMQYLIYAFQIPGKNIALFYGKDVFKDIISDWHKYHTFGADQFVENITEKYGLSPEVTSVKPIRKPA